MREKDKAIVEGMCLNRRVHVLVGRLMWLQRSSFHCSSSEISSKIMS